jgi:hypothetical protein
VLDPGTIELEASGSRQFPVTRSTSYVLTIDLDGERFQLTDRVIVE